MILCIIWRLAWHNNLHLLSLLLLCCLLAMSSRSNRSRLGICFIILISVGGFRAFSEWRNAMPEQGRSATEVVLLQLSALQQNDPGKDDGIAKTFDFASTRNKAVTGPLPRFAQMIHAGYPMLLNSQNFTLLSALQLSPTEYTVRVEILGNLETGNEKNIIVWQLSDSGDGTGWRTDAVMPDKLAWVDLLKTYRRHQASISWQVNES